MSKCEDCFNDWWLEYRENSDIAKQEAWAIWESAFSAGGFQPWYSLTKEQIKILIKSIQEE